MILFVVAFCSMSVVALVSGASREPPTFRGLDTIAELAAYGGYTTTNYEVITEDGYSLWLFRIGNNTGPPVLIQHGLGVAADQWVTRGPAKDLAFILLEKGFDVYLSSQRGTVFNEYSLKYTRSDPRFWDFSFHESGFYDMPAFIDTILKLRRKDKLFYIGHSAGTTVFLVMCSLRPEYNSKIQAAVLLSPVAFTPLPEEQALAFRSTSENIDLLQNGYRLAGITEFAGRSQQSIDFFKRFCTGDAPTRNVCLDVVGAFSGEHRTNLDPKDFDFFVPYFGVGTSFKTFYHIFKNYQTGEFRMYNYGTAENIKRYGRTIPPSYPVRRVTAPVAIFWGYNDVVTSDKSVNRLASMLPNLIVNKAVPDPNFSHIDMYIGKNANRVLYPDIVRILRSFSGADFPVYGKDVYSADIKDGAPLSSKEVILVKETTKEDPTNHAKDVSPVQETHSKPETFSKEKPESSAEE